jgi:hypothetical protein
VCVFATELRKSCFFCFCFCFCFSVIYYLFRRALLSEEPGVVLEAHPDHVSAVLEAFSKANVPALVIGFVHGSGESSEVIIECADKIVLLRDKVCDKKISSFF